MAEITFEEARRQLDALGRQARVAEERADWQAAIRLDAAAASL